MKGKKLHKNIRRILTYMLSTVIVLHSFSGIGSVVYAEPEAVVESKTEIESESDDSLLELDDVVEEDVESDDNGSEEDLEIEDENQEKENDYANETKGKSSDEDFIIDDFGVLTAYVGNETEIHIPDRVHKIASNALTKHAIKDIYLPVGLEEIEHGAVLLTGGSKIYLPDGWKGNCKIYDYDREDNTPSFTSPYGKDFGCTLVISSDVKNVTEIFSEVTKAIIVKNSAENEKYKQSSWYQYVKKYVPVFDDDEFDEDGFVIKSSVLMAYDGDGGDLVIPETAARISKKVFQGMDIFDSITIPDYVVDLGEGCFQNLRSRCKKLTIGNGVQIIPEDCFCEMKGCKELKLGNSIEFIGNRAFMGNRATEISIPESVRHIGDRAFAKCNNVQNIDFSHVETFGEYVFGPENHVNLEVLNLSSATLLEYASFYGITAKELIIGEKLKEIPTLALAGKFEKIVWPKEGRLKKIGHLAFKNTSSEILNNNPIPNSVTYFGGNLFSKDKLCSTLRIPQKLESFGYLSIPLEKDACIYLPDSWEGNCEFGDNTIVPDQEDDYEMTLVIPKTIHDLEDYWINAPFISRYVIEKYPDEPSDFSEMEWYQKLVTVGKRINVESISDCKYVCEKVKGSNEFLCTYVHSITSDKINYVRFSIPKGFSYVKGSLQSDIGFFKSASENSVMAGINIESEGTLTFKLVQNEINSESKNIEIIAQNESNDDISKAMLSTVYGNFTGECIGNKFVITVTTNRNQSFTLIADGVIYTGKTNSKGRAYLSVPVREDKIAVSVKVGEIKLGEKNFDVKLMKKNAPEISMLTVANSELDGGNRAIDITYSGSVVGAYPKNLYTFEMKSDEFKNVEDLYLINGEERFSFAKAGNRYVAQGYLTNPKQTIEIQYKDITIHSTDVKWMMDPSGFVYELYADNRVEGAKLSIYYSSNKKGMNAQKWNAENYGQVNDLTTGSKGLFSWNVPNGYYQIVASKDGYETVKSEWISVPPPQLNVNLAMRDIREPRIKGISMGKDHATIYFDKYMNSQAFRINDEIFLMSDDTIVTLQKAEFLDEIESGYFKTIRYSFKTPLTANEFLQTYNLVINQNSPIESYTGKPLEMDYDVITKIKPEQQEVTKLKVDNGATMRLGKRIQVKVKLRSEDNQPVVKPIIANSRNNNIVNIVEISKTDRNGIARIMLESKGYGETKIEFEAEGTNVKAEIPVVVVANTEMKEKMDKKLKVNSPPIEREPLSEQAVFKFDLKEKAADTTQNETSEQSKTEEKKSKKPKKGKSYTVDGIIYKVTKAKTNGDGTVSVVGAVDSDLSSVSIPGKVTISDYEYKVVKIQDKAFMDCHNLRSVTLGVNITKIGKRAFAGCTNLKSIKVKSHTLKSVGRKALEDINAKCKIKVPEKKVTKYSRLFYRKGQSDNVKITK